MLTFKTILGAGWTVSSRLAGRLIDFCTVLILARSLAPADFGLTALAMTMISVLDIVLEIPLIQALTRLKSIEKLHLDTAFTIGLLRGLLLTIVVLAAAWPFSVIFHDGRLTALVAVLSFGPMSRSLYSPGMVYFMRQMSFRPIFIAELGGKSVAAAMAITVVYAGGGYWAIATSSVLSSAATVVISYILAPYRPGFSLSKISDFSTYLGWFSSSQVISALSWQFDRILLGYFVTKSALGQYSMAGDLAVLPTQSLIGPAMQPVMAAFSRINDDPTRLANAYLKASRLTMMIAMPVCVGMSLTSDLIINVLLGPKWTEAADYLRWLALATMLTAYSQPLYSLALAISQPNVLFRLQFIELILKVSLISLGLAFFSLHGAVAARGMISLVMFALALTTATTLAGISARSEASSLIKTGVACLIMTILVLLFRDQSAGHLNSVLELILSSGLGATVYVAVLFAFGVRITKF